MLLLPVDEAFAFDYLAILRIKAKFGHGDADVHSELEKHLATQTGPAVFRSVLESAEWAALLKANEATFNAIELAHKNAISAADVQWANHQRFLAKRALQQRFWPGKPLTEVKTLC